MSFKWLAVPLQTRFGEVVGLHWDYITEDEIKEAAGTSGKKRTNLTHAPKEATGGAGAGRGVGRVLSDVGDLADAEDELGAVMWNANGVACDAIAQYVAAQPSDRGELRHWDVLELGAGVGVLGVALAAGGANVMMTDLPRLVPLMNRTVRENRPAAWANNVVAVGFDWTRELPREVSTFVRGRLPQRPLLVVMCDALYGNPKCWPALINHLRQIAVDGLAARGQRVTFLNLCEQRVEDHERAFFDLLGQDVNATWDIESSRLGVSSELGLPVQQTVFGVARKARRDDAAAEREEGAPPKSMHRREV
jgi:predicted nicotinamide N-methyase